MSLIFGALVGLFLHFLPTMMCLYYRASTLITVIVLVLNLFTMFTFGVSWFIAFIIACIGIKFWEIVKSLLFAVFLMVLTSIFAAAELSFIVSMLS